MARLNKLIKIPKTFEKSQLMSSCGHECRHLYIDSIIAWLFV